MNSGQISEYSWRQDIQEYPGYSEYFWRKEAGIGNVQQLNEKQKAYAPACVNS